MELILFFSLVFSIFIGLIVCIVGLVNAPTPILLGILVGGVVLTQKSIDKLTSDNMISIDDSEL